MTNRISYGRSTAEGRRLAQQDFDPQAVSRRKQRVMGLIAEGLPERNGRLFELLQRLDEPSIDLRRSAGLIAAEPEMHSSILKFCEYSGSVARSDNPLRLPEAIVLLGRDQLRVLLLGQALSRFAAQCLQPATLESFWRHSLRAAVRGREIALRSKPKFAEQAYLGGLLHDIGRLPLLVTARETATTSHLVDLLDDDASAERAFFGVDHCQVGRWMALAGSLPNWLIDIIEHHHEPEGAVDYRTLVALVAAADRTAQLPSRKGPMQTTSAIETACYQPKAPVPLSLLAPRPRGLEETDRATRSRFLQNTRWWDDWPLFGSS